jgi:hypothetical protein
VLVAKVAKPGNPGSERPGLTVGDETVADLLQLQQQKGHFASDVPNVIV